MLKIQAKANLEPCYSHMETWTKLSGALKPKWLVFPGMKIPVSSVLWSP